MARPRKNITLDFNEIETHLNSSTRIDLKTLALKHGTCSPVIRRILSETYGTKIKFYPGRSGGIRWNVLITQPTNTLPTPMVAEPQTVSV